jgi:RNA polymerase sigma-70 factor (ECF subfamily)
MATSKFPSSAKEAVLHGRILAEDPVAPADLFETFMGPLSATVRYDLKCLEDEAYDSAIDAILAYLETPNRYVHQLGRLSTYLVEITKRRAIDRMRSRTARERREKDFAQVLELSTTAPKEAMILQVEARRLWAKVKENMTNERDKKTLQLILEGETSTEILAKELGLEDLPPQTRQEAVKRHRDRLMSALKRLGKKS